MGVEVRYNRDKTGRRVMRPTWYGGFTLPDGRRSSLNLGVAIEGRPGSQQFMASRKRAEEALADFMEKMKAGRTDRTTARRVFEASTGRAAKDIAIADLASVLDREGARKVSPAWDATRRAWLADFVSWAGKKSIYFAKDVTRETARAYLAEIYADGKGARTAATIGKMRAVLSGVFAEALPEGEPNPWHGEGVAVQRAEGDALVHRIPLTDSEVDTLLEASREDRMAHDIITCGLCTALRRGDVCRLRWRDVDLAAGVIHLRTHKTGAEVYLPIFEALRAVLEGRLAERKEGAEYVFPEAEYILRTNPDGISWRVKKVFARAFFNPAEAAITEAGENAPETVNLAEALPRVTAAVKAAAMTEGKRAKTIDLLARYAKGESFRDIEAETGVSRGGISGLLHGAEELAGVTFMPDKRKAYRAKDAIAELTRTARAVGGRRASVRDFHSLRTSFVTLALRHGVPVEKITAITGHATVETALKFYAQTKGTDFRADFEKALPEALTKRREAVPVETREMDCGAAGARLGALAKKLADTLRAVRELSPEERAELARMIGPRNS